MMPIGNVDYQLDEKGEHTTTDEKGNIVQKPLTPPEQKKAVKSLRQQVEEEKAAYHRSRPDLWPQEQEPAKQKSIWERLFGE